MGVVVGVVVVVVVVVVVGGAQLAESHKAASGDDSETASCGDGDGVSGCSCFRTKQA